jgi:hypothetical protein
MNEQARRKHLKIWRKENGLIPHGQPTPTGRIFGSILVANSAQNAGF